MRDAAQGPYGGAAPPVKCGAGGTGPAPVISKLAAAGGGSGREEAQVAIVMARLRDG